MYIDTTSSGEQYDHRRKLESKNNQYLPYISKSESATGAIPASVAYKADIKFDDGKPMTGRFTTFSTQTLLMILKIVNMQNV